MVLIAPVACLSGCGGDPAGLCPAEYDEVAACAGGVGASAEDSASRSGSRAASIVPPLGGP